MRALPIVLAVASTALVGACGQAASHPSRHGLAHMAPVSLARPRSPQITGGTAAQRALLGRIVRAQDSTQIVRLTIAPADSSWKPRPGDVQLTAKLAGGR